MRRTPSSTGTFTRSARRPRLALAVAALAVLAVGGCGTAKTGTGGEQGVRAEAVGSRQGAEGTQSGESRQSAPSLAELREYIERTCPAPGTPPVAPPVPGPPPGGPSSVPTALPPGERPPTGPVEPVMPTAGPEVELDGRDWCAGVHHEQRVAEALLDLADPTPAKVRTVLGGLGYADDRVHGLKQSGATTLFFVDLREKGGKLCLEGTAAGAETVVDKCVAPATGPFAPGGRKR